MMLVEQLFMPKVIRQKALVETRLASAYTYFAVLNFIFFGTAFTCIVWPFEEFLTSCQSQGFYMIKNGKQKSSVEPRTITKAVHFNLPI